VIWSTPCSPRPERRSSGRGQSADAGLDVAVWSAEGETWSRHDSAGTPLQSTRQALGFATDATGYGQGILIVGWEL
jgi:hypothetical protein